MGPDFDDGVGFAISHVGRGGQDEFESQDIYRIVFGFGAIELAEGFTQSKTRLGGQGDAGYFDRGLRQILGELVMLVDFFNGLGRCCKATEKKDKRYGKESFHVFSIAEFIFIAH